MTESEFSEASEYWIKKDRESVAMPREELEERIKDYLEKNKVAALATGSGSHIRSTPIEYSFHHDALWMFSEGGLKFRGIEENEYAAISIYSSDPTFGKLSGMQLTGKVTLPEPFGKEYTEAAEYKKIPLDMLRKLPSVMHLIKFVPDEITFLCSAFKDQGYGSRQTWKRSL